MGSLCHDLVLVVWKAYKLRWYRKYTSMVLILLAVAVFTFLTEYILPSRHEFTASPHSNYEKQETLLKQIDDSVELYYSPRNDKATKQVIRIVQRLLSRKFIAKSSLEIMLTDFLQRENLESRRKNRSEINQIWVIFDNNTFIKSEQNTSPNKTKIYGYSIASTELSRKSVDEDNWMESYQSSGCLAVNLAVNIAIIEWATTSSGLRRPDFEIGINMFPQSRQYTRRYWNVPTYVAIYTFYFITLVIFCIETQLMYSQEKQFGISEMYAFAGLKRFRMQIGWFLYMLIANVVVVIVGACLLFRTFVQSSPFLLLTCFLMYTVMALSVFLVFSSFFTAVRGCVIAPTIWIIAGHMSAKYLSPLVTASSLAIRILSMFIPPLGLQHSLTHFSIAEALGNGVGFSDCFTEVVPYKYTPIGFVLVVWSVMTVFNMCFLTYLENIMPGPLGSPKPICYPFTKKPRPKRFNRRAESGSTFWEFVEEVPFARAVAIRLRVVSKKRQRSDCGKAAIDKISIDFYRGEITTLLGHSGSGKSDLLQLIAGLHKPNQGTIHVMGRDVNEERDKLRGLVGYCPQSSTKLCNYLTARDNLYIYSRIKGRSRKMARKETDNIVKRLGMYGYEHKYTSELTPGELMRVFLGTALTGGCRLLLLDEPTTALDPENRKNIWNMLLGLKNDKTILISTQYMEEADFLGDRIAILSDGRITCCGTPKYLRNTYGPGYSLHIMTEVEYDLSALTMLLESNVPKIKLRVAMGRTRIYNIPMDQSSNFTNLFKIMDEEGSHIGIISYNITITSMEEVFLRATSTARTRTSLAGTHPDIILKGAAHLKKMSVDIDNKASNTVHPVTWTRSTGMTLWIAQMKALFKKRLMFMKQKWWLLIIVHCSVSCAIAYTFLFSSETETIVFLSEDEQSTLNDLTAPKYIPAILYSTDNSKMANDVAYEYYKTQIKRKPHQIRDDSDVASTLSRILNRKPSDFDEMYPVAAHFEKNERGKLLADAYYSSIVYRQAGAVSLNILSNSILQYFLRNNKSSIRVSKYDINNPFVNMEKSSFSVPRRLKMWQFIVPILLIFSISVAITQPCQERNTGSKHQQLMTPQLSIYKYWFTFYAIDMFIYAILITGYVIMAAVYSSFLHFEHQYELAVIWILLLAFGMSMHPMSYIFSMFFSSSGINVLAFLMWNFIFIVIVNIVNIVVETFSASRYIAYVFPQYSIMTAFMKFNTLLESNSKCSGPLFNPKICSSVTAMYNPCCPQCKEVNICHKRHAYFEFSDEDDPNGMLLELVYMLGTSVFFFLVLFLAEAGVLGMLLVWLLDLVYPGRAYNSSKDEDVRNEDLVIKHLLKQRAYDQYPDLLVSRLCKKVHGRFPAVRGVSFRLQRGECLGLVGVNGSGKTTTFKMLSGMIYPNTGTAVLFGKHDLKRSPVKFVGNISYCPQEHTFNQWQTVKDIMTFIATIRGVPIDKRDEEVLKWMNIFDLQKYSDKVAYDLNHGDQRKVDIAACLVGSMAVLLLDEPGTRLDPLARRNLCEVLFTLCHQEKKLIIFTSHYMEDCEAICNHIGVMVNGRFVGYGTIPHLISRFSQTLNVTIRIKQNMRVADRVKLSVNILESYEDLSFIGEHLDTLYYQLNVFTSWPEIFANLERIQTSFAEVEQYIVSQPSLEDVFLRLAKYKYEELLLNLPAYCCPQHKQNYVRRLSSYIAPDASLFHITTNI